MFKRKYIEAVEEGQRAITINLNGVECLAPYSFVLSCANETDDAIRVGRRAIRLNPIPLAISYIFLGWAYHSNDQYREVIEVCHKALGINPYIFKDYHNWVP